MFEILVPMIATLASFYIWGILRTAIWLGLSLLAGEFSILISATVLSFFGVMVALAPYRAGAFDLRDLTKQEYTLGFFLTGVCTGLLFWPPHLLHYVAALLVAYILIQIFKIFRLPSQRVIFAPKYLKFILFLAWFVALALRFAKWNLDL